jgi:Mitochondrial mRNA-processing protein COX24, C-terminal
MASLVRRPTGRSDPKGAHGSRRSQTFAVDQFDRATSGHRPDPAAWFASTGSAAARVTPLMGSLIKKRRKRMRKKKHKKMLKRTRWQRRAAGK